jgi:hypothetical protein
VDTGPQAGLHLMVDHLRLRDGNGPPREITLVRNGGFNVAPIGPIFFPPAVKSIGRQAYGKTPRGIGYIHLRDVPADLPAQLDSMLATIGYGLGDTPTAGMSAAKMTLPVPSGLFAARFGVRSHMQRWNKGRGLEGIGIAPTETLSYSPAELLSGIDTQIRRAEDLLQSGFPPDAVDYAPPATPKH